MDKKHSEKVDGDKKCDGSYTSKDERLKLVEKVRKAFSNMSPLGQQVYVDMLRETCLGELLSEPDPKEGDISD